MEKFKETVVVKFERTITNAYGIQDNYVMSINSQTYHTITGEIFKDDESIGKLTLYEIAGYIDLGDMSLQIPGDTAVIADAICDYNGNLKYDNIENLVILDQMHLEPEYRNQGYGSLVAKSLMTMLNDAYGHNIDLIVLYASIFDVETYRDAPIGTFEKDVDRLVKFYEKAGYEHLENNVMIKMKG